MNPTLKMGVTVLALTCLACLAACSEKPQTFTGGGKQDSAAYLGTGSAFVAPGWKVGDKTSWEQQLKTRMQNSQNDYSKAN